MEWIAGFLEFFQGVDEFFIQLLQNHGVWTYFLLFLIVFCETAVLFMSFLPGDPLLIVVGTMCAAGGINPFIAIPVLIVAAITGNTAGYWVGLTIGHRLFSEDKTGLFRIENLDKTKLFYERYGPIAIVLSRFFAIARAFAPLLAGMTAMPFVKFSIYNIVGGAVWVLSLTMAGYFFGKLDLVRENITLAIGSLLIVLLVLFPVVIGYLKFAFRGLSGDKNKGGKQG